MKKLSKLLLSLSIVTTGFTAVATAAPNKAGFDPAADFCAASNPSQAPCANDAWSYGWSQTFGSEFILDDLGFMRDGLEGWGTNPAAGPDPSILHNATNATIYLAGVIPVPAGGILIHPGPGGELNIVRWTAPSNGVYKLDVTFTRMDIGETDAHVVANGKSLLNAQLNNSKGVARIQNKTLRLPAGATIDFALGMGADGNYISDNTALAATINKVAGLPNSSFKKQQ